jgi:hypothetical protein
MAPTPVSASTAPALSRNVLALVPRDCTARARASARRSAAEDGVTSCAYCIAERPVKAQETRQSKRFRSGSVQQRDVRNRPRFGFASSPLAGAVSGRSLPDSS